MAARSRAARSDFSGVADVDDTLVERDLLDRRSRYEELMNAIRQATIGNRIPRVCLRHGVRNKASHRCSTRCRYPPVPARTSRRSSESTHTHKGESSPQPSDDEPFSGARLQEL